MSDLEIIKQLEKELGKEISKLEKDDHHWHNPKAVEKNPVSFYSPKSYKNEEEIVQTLILHNCKLTKIPEQIYLLRNLTTLILSNNQITEISSAILNLNKLFRLDISNNLIYKLPDELFGFSKEQEDQGMSSHEYHFNFANNKLERIPEVFVEEYCFLILNEADVDIEPVGDKSSINIIGNNLKFPPLITLKDNKYSINEYYRIQNEFKTEDIYFNNESKSTLTYSIKSFKVNNFHGLNNLEIKNIPVDTKWIFFTGENGYGKTSILQAIVIGLFGNEDGKIILNKEGEIYLELKTETENIVSSVDKKYDFSYKFQHFAAYGPARLTKSPHPFIDSKTNSLFNSLGELYDIEERLIAWEKDKDQNKYFESALEILKELLNPQIYKILIDREGTETTVKYIETADKFKDNQSKKIFIELASGYRSIISMIGDIIIRLSRHKKEIINFKELSGIVIIDELDLHLHPKWQVQLVRKLTEIFPKIQFIASTHSPIPLLGAPENSIIINVQRNDKDGITAKKLDIDFSTLTPNSILTSPIFDFQDIIPISKTNEKFLNTENNYKDISEKQKMQKEISSFLTEEKAQELLNLLNFQNEKDK